MSRLKRFHSVFLIWFTLTLCMTASAGPAAKELSWDDLMPPLGALPAPAFPGSGIPGKDGADRNNGSPDVSLYSRNPVLALNGKYVKLPGYIVPLDSDEGGLLNEFLLVPYFGACIHVPPPPPNQIVYVKLKKPFDLRDMNKPYWVTGTITTQLWSGDMADSDYVMAADQVEVYRY